MGKHKTVIAYISLSIAMIVWGSSYIAMKIALQAYDPYVIVCGRMLIGGLCLFPFLIRDMGSIERKDWLLFILMCCAEPCLFFLFEAKALTLTSASQAGMVAALLPLLVAFLAHFFLKEELSKSMLIGFLIAFSGVIWLSFGSEASESAVNPLLGNSFEVLAIIAASIYTLLMKKLSSKYSSLFITAYQCFQGSLFFILLVAARGTEISFAWQGSASFAIIYLGAFVTLGGYGLYNFGTSLIPASKSSAMTNLIPLVSLILGIVILNEGINTSQLLASTLVLSGVIISQLQVKKRSTQSAVS